MGRHAAAESQPGRGEQTGVRPPPEDKYVGVARPPPGSLISSQTEGTPTYPELKRIRRKLGRL